MYNKHDEKILRVLGGEMVMDYEKGDIIDIILEDQIKIRAEILRASLSGEIQIRITGGDELFRRYWGEKVIFDPYESGNRFGGRTVEQIKNIPQGSFLTESDVHDLLLWAVDEDDRETFERVIEERGMKK